MGQRGNEYQSITKTRIYVLQRQSITYKCELSQVLIEEGRAVGVSFVRDNQLRTVRATKEVILSAGALKSPQILMLSGIGDREHLEQHQVR